MENWLPQKMGDRFAVISYVDTSTFMKIEAMRGDVSRSRFVGKLIKKLIEQ